MVVNNPNDPSLIEDGDGDTKIQTEESADEDIIRFDIGGVEYWTMAVADLLPTFTETSDIGSDSLRTENVFSHRLDIKNTDKPSDVSNNFFNLVSNVTETASSYTPGSQTIMNIDIDYDYDFGGYGGFNTTMTAIRVDMDATDTSAGLSTFNPVLFNATYSQDAGTTHGGGQMFIVSADSGAASFGSGAYLFSVSGSGGNLACLRTSATVSGSGIGIGYQGFAASATSATGQLIGVEGITSNVGTTGSCIAFNAKPGGSIDGDLIMTFKGSAGHIMNGGNLLILDSNPATPNLVSTTHLDNTGFNGQGYFKGLLEVDGVIYGDGGADIGDGTNKTLVSATGDVTFEGGGGLAYGDLSAYDTTTTITIGSSGIANKVQITAFATNGVSNNTTPDHTNDHITVSKAGHYMCTVSIAAESVTGAAALYGFGVWVNNGATQKTNLHSHRNLAGGAGDRGSISMSGIIDLAASDTVEVWVYNETNTQNIVIDDITLSLVQIGGT